ncbi:MAG: hypothetical protein ACKVPY_12975 [Paracoccaceae bacterium]
MSTWTSRGRAPAALAALAGLAACVMPGPSGGGGATALPVAGGAVTIAGPPGYCADRAGSRDDGTRAFVLLGSCAALAPGPFATGPANPAILTASVLGQGLAGGEPMGAVLPEMARFFGSAEGRAALSRAGRAATVEVAGVERSADTLFLRVRDTAPMAGVAVEPEYWRAVLLIRGRIVTLSVLAPAAAPLSAAGKRATLDAFVARVRRASGSA